jgi:hypothetical protein
MIDNALVTQLGHFSMGKPQTNRQLAVLVRRPKTVAVAVNGFPTDIKTVTRWIEDQKIQHPQTSYEAIWLVPVDQWKGNDV